MRTMSSIGARALMRVSHLTRLKTYIAGWRRSARSRRELSKFDHRGLQDIGISRCDADQEISKPFWDS